MTDKRLEDIFERQVAGIPLDAGLDRSQQVQMWHDIEWLIADRHPMPNEVDQCSKRYWMDENGRYTCAIGDGAICQLPLGHPGGCKGAASITDTNALINQMSVRQVQMEEGLRKLIKRAAWRSQDVAERLCAQDLSEMAQEILDGKEPM